MRRCGAICAVLCLSIGSTLATTRNVPGDVATIQGAIDASTSGDIVLVSPGTYLESLDFTGKNIAVRSTNGAAATTIHAIPGRSVARFQTGETLAATLDGFTLTGGAPDPFSTQGNQGAGIYIYGASPTIVNNIVTGNAALYGGGIYLSGSASLVSGNLITGNNASGGGGAFYITTSTADISGNRIENNSGCVGSAFELWDAGNSVVRNNLILRNQGLCSCGGGAGTITMVNHSDVDFIQNVIAWNSASCGGGFSWLTPKFDRGPFLLNNTIAFNTALQGAAIYSDGFPANVRLVNNLLVGAAGSAVMYCDNSFGGVETPTLANNDIYAGGTVPFGGTCPNAIGQSGNVSGLARFVNAANDQFGIGPGSAGLDAGTSAGVALPATDLAGQPRVLDGDGNGVAIVDMGALEGAVPGPLALYGATSRKMHGAVAYWLPLGLVSTNPTTEPRSGPAQQIVLTFNKPISAGTASIAAGVATAGTQIISGPDLVFDLSGVADQQYVTVTAANVTSAYGETGGTGSVRVGFLAGDVNQNRVVTLADLAQVNAQLSQPVTAANFLKDVNVNGTLTLADKGVTNGNLTKALPPP
jgi:hypothetical protein